MLRVHFLNVGHGDCTIIKHHSGRLTMVDINTSQDYDSESFNELVAEEAQKANPFALGFTAGAANTLLGRAYQARPTGNALFGLGHQSPGNTLLGLAQTYPPGYYEALAKAKTELTDPIKFLQDNYHGEKLCDSSSRIPI